MSRSLKDCLVGGHTDAVRDDLGKYFVFFDCRKLEFLKSDVVCTVNSYRFCFHCFLSPFFLSLSRRLPISSDLSFFRSGRGVSDMSNTSPSFNSGPKKDTGMPKVFSLSSMQTAYSPSILSTVIIIILSPHLQIITFCVIIITAFCSNVNTVSHNTHPIKEINYG